MFLLLVDILQGDDVSGKVLESRVRRHGLLAFRSFSRTRLGTKPRDNNAYLLVRFVMWL